MAGVEARACGAVVAHSLSQALAAAAAAVEAAAPLELVSDILGPNVSAATRETVARAESREQAYALLMLSPEFQRR